MKNLLLLIPLFSIGFQIYACDCAPRSPSRSYLSSTVVAIGVAQGEMSSEDGQFYQSPIKVVSSFKGALETQIVVSQAKTNCLVPFKKGQAYLIYATLEDGKLITNQCRRTRSLAAPDLAEDLLALPLTVNQIEF